MTFKKRLAGFTLLEILIVLAVFGLLATLAVISLNTARAKLRDAQRVSDISVLRSSLSQYSLDKSTFPLVPDGVNLGQPGTNTDVLTGQGFVGADAATPPIYLSHVPRGPKVNEFYRYHGGPSGYSIRFQTESDTTFGKANVYYAHTGGVDGTDEEK